ncbi:uncharacterized protein LOC128844547 isoform X2 [Malaclemys terrapin pileata]|uniref:uncharacterized protein LOC128844547 isoform X2 n=1 Tax=Malaclemys terrapin pileata TaxID=2991368 RepID=UPI0023A86EA4|nr:uncharacterized protein LOC128844547 isoform X2 [Malaclemys terrapin pileata]
MYFLVILAFLGRITGETFFHHYENGNFTLTCNETVANGKKETVWYESRESLHEFQVINCSNQQPNGRNKCSDKTKCRNQLSNSASRGGGVFAYKEIFETIPAKSHDNHLVQEERSNITLSCEFQMKPSGQTFLIYWIKYTETSKCLSSVQRKEHNFSYNTHCCIDEMIKERLLNYTSLDSTERHVVHNMTILNVTYSDSGTYLCVVNAWSRGKHVWKIANNLSIEVRNQAIPSSASVPLYATTGFFVGIIIISGIAWLIYKKKIKSKGKASAQLPRAQAALEIPGDECSPYAVSSSKDLQGNEVLYSLATSPYEDPNAAYCTVDNTAASGKGPGDEIQTVYAVVSQSCSCK